MAQNLIKQYLSQTNCRGHLNVPYIKFPKTKLQQKGSILMISLWVTAILAIMAISLSRQTMTSLKLANYQKDRLKASYLAQAGIKKALLELKNDTVKEYDSLDETWNQNSTIYFNNDQTEYFTTSITDEAGKININTADTNTTGALLEKTSLDQEQIQELANYILAWRGDTVKGFNAPESSKSEKLTNSEELIIILERYFYNKNIAEYNEKAQEIFSQLKNLITLYSNEGKLNINTASSETLEITIKGIAENEDQKNLAYNLAKDIINKRDENKHFSNKDELVLSNIEPATAIETLFNNLKEKLAFNSNYFKIISIGSAQGALKQITAIFNREDEKFTYWHEE